MRHLKPRLKILFKIIDVAIFLPFYRKLFAQQGTNRIFNGKRIALVGPATSAFHTAKGEYIDSFDIIVRMNGGPMFLKANDFFKKDIGSRTDVLFHNLNEDKGTSLDFDLYKLQELKYLITYFGHKKKSLDYRILKYLRSYRNLFCGKLFLIEPSITSKLHKLLSPNAPTTGIITVKTIIEANFKELYITGITFGNTPYMLGYDRIREENGIDLLNWLTDHPTHNVAKEQLLFTSIIAKKKEKIILDNILTDLISVQNQKE